MKNPSTPAPLPGVHSGNPKTPLPSHPTLSRCSGAGAWRGAADWSPSAHDTDRFCTGPRNGNVLAYVDRVVHGDFAFTLILDTALTNAGWVLGFFETDSPHTHFDFAYPDNEQAAGPRWAFSSAPWKNDGRRGIVWTSERRGTIRKNAPECDTAERNSEITVRPGSTVTLSRTSGNFVLLIDGQSKYHFKRASHGNGYVWLGHYNAKQPQCFSRAVLCTTTGGMMLPQQLQIVQTQSQQTQTQQRQTRHPLLWYSYAIVAAAAMLITMLAAYLYLRCCRSVARTVKVYVRNSSGGGAETHITSTYEGRAALRSASVLPKRLGAAIHRVRSTLRSWTAKKL